MGTTRYRSKDSLRSAFRPAGPGYPLPQSGGIYDGTAHRALQNTFFHDQQPTDQPTDETEDTKEEDDPAADERYARCACVRKQKRSGE